MPNKKILDQFRVRDDSNRARFLECLYLKIGNQVPLTEVLDHVYGKKKGSMTAFSNVRGSIELIIKRKKLPYEIESHRTKRGLTIGLYHTVDTKVIT